LWEWTLLSDSPPDLELMVVVRRVICWRYCKTKEFFSSG